MIEVELENVSKVYRDAQRNLTILQSVNVRFAAGRSTAIVGRSGIGKSTLLHLIGGLDRPTSGSVRVAGREISRLSSDELARFRGSSIGFVFQQQHLLPEFSALENVAMPLIIAGASAGRWRVAAQRALERVGLAARLSHLPSQLSGGEQQRVALARAIVSDPALLLADEPTGSLDAATAADIQSLLLGLSRDLGKTLIVVTHSAELAAALDVRLEMHAGGELTPAGPSA